MANSILTAAPSRLDDDIPLLEELDRIRERCEQWRNEGMASLATAGKPLPDGMRWSSGAEIEIDDRALIVKALCRETREKLPPAAQEHLDFLRKAKVTDVLSPAFEVQGLSTDMLFRKSRIHLLDCALALTALSSAPSGVFSSSTMFFYYVVVRELYETAPKKWTVGAARAGVGGTASALATSELVRGILSFARMLRRTGAYIESLAELQRQRTPPLKQWESQDSTRRALALYTTLAQRAFNLAFPLRPEDAVPGGFDDASITDFERTIHTTLTRSLSGSVKTFKEALNAVRAYRRAEWRAAGKDPKKVHLLSRSESAHAVGERVLQDALQRAARALHDFQANGSDDADFGERLHELKKAFEDGAAEARRLIEPSIDHFGAILDREIAAASADPGAGGFEAWEMATAAAGLGAALGNWDDERIERAARHLTEVIGPDGFVISKPYFVGLGAYYQPPQPFAIRAYAQILEHVDRVDLSTVALRRMVSSFERTRSSIDKHRSSWRWTYAENPKEHSIYHTAIATLALDRICRMLDARINSRVLLHFAHKKPSEITFRLNQLFYPDYGLTELKKESDKPRLSIAAALERMRAHLAGTRLREPYEESFYSAVFHGPPGTGKTTLLEALAGSAAVTLVEVTPSEIVVEGADKVEARARSVLRALSLLTRVVIVFDEFDPVLRTREGQDDTAPSIFAFLTPSMLPKLKKLYDAAKKRRIAYALITNVIRELDPAAIRSGRFDANIGVYPPDMVSRFGRLWNEVCAFEREYTGHHPRTATLNRRFERVIRGSAEASMQHVAKPGWFTRPADAKRAPRPGTIFAYLFAPDDQETAFPAIQTTESWSDEQLSSEEKSDMDAVRSLDDANNDRRNAMWEYVANAFETVRTRRNAAKS
jgi:hypothetical protein